MFQAIILCNLKENKWAKLEKKVKHLISSPILGPQFFLYVLCLLDVRHCSKLLLYAISRKTYDQNSRKWQKTSFWVWFRLVGLLFFFFFFKTLVLSVTRYHSQLSSCTISEKTNDPISRTFSDGHTDIWTDWQSDIWWTDTCLLRIYLARARLYSFWENQNWFSLVL